MGRAMVERRRSPKRRVFATEITDSPQATRRKKGAGIGNVMEDFPYIGKNAVHDCGRMKIHPQAG